MTNISRVLIANRGEIAIRIIRACREMGLSPVAVYGEGEESFPHVRAADDAYLLPSGSGLPYLSIDAVIEAAKRANAQAIHPGYGFLSENADFVRAVEQSGIIFVGPDANSVRQLGDKVQAREIAVRANVPVVPGTREPVQSVSRANDIAADIGFPLAVKAAAGGGGRGFRVARSASEIEVAFVGAAGEAQRYFGNDTVYFERYLERPRHIEIQIVADTHGSVVWLGERDCSVQRRHQKLIEETPSPAVDKDLRQRLGEAAARLAREVSYVNAGTVEFLVDSNNDFYFLEMNSRIQVEHTITEEVTGLDLVKEQLRVAMGCSLSFSQEEVQPRGHAIQCRINAEDAGDGFKPTSGAIEEFRPPDGPGIRVDSAMEPGGLILPSYDSMIAKLVAWGRDRDESIARMSRALGEFVIEGVPTTIPFHSRVMAHPAFEAGDVTTAFLEEHGTCVLPPATGASTSSQASGLQPRNVLVEVGGRRLNVRIHDDSPTPNKGYLSSNSRPRLADRGSGLMDRTVSGNEIASPLQGTVVRVSVFPGDEVEVGDIVCVVEAMKMENEITAHRSGTLAALEVRVGDSVFEGSPIATLE